MLLFSIFDRHRCFCSVDHRATQNQPENDTSQLPTHKPAKSAASRRRITIPEKTSQLSCLPFTNQSESRLISNMEVASPLSFAHAAAGGKRPLLASCSPGIVDSTNCGPAVEDFHQRAFKRRRFAVDESMGLDNENTTTTTTPNPNPFLSHNTAIAQQQHRLHFTTNDQSLKRCRTEALCMPPSDSQKIIEEQSAEINTLKTDKSNLETSLTSLRTEHEKVVNENKILKKAVTIQQERQNQASSAIDAANRYKLETDDKIKKLEQIILSLRYHLQAQPQSNLGNDFMGFPPRPPDVY